MDTQTLAYLAGAVDCDGSINVQRQHRKRVSGRKVLALMVRLTFVQVNPDVPRLFERTFGGNVYFYVAPYRERTRGWHQWYVGGAAAANAIRALLPYLVLKKTQAELVLQLWSMLDEQRRLRNGQTLTAAQEAERLRLADAVRALNARRTMLPATGRQHSDTPSGTTLLQ